MYLATNGTTVVLRMAVVWVLVDVLSLGQAFAPPVAVALTTPIAFLLTRWAMRERPAQGAGTRPRPDRTGRARVAV
jgi:hypothetical protein